MKYANTTYSGVPEWLAADDFVAIPAHITESTAVLSGTPIDADGKAVEDPTAQDAETPVGILLYDVNPANNPNCALLVQGVIDLTKMNAHSGLTLTAAGINASLPGIICRTNIGVNS